MNTKPRQMEVKREMAAAPVVRQLDFTIILTPNANANVNLILPEPDLVKLRKLHEIARSQSLSRTPHIVAVQPQKVVVPPKSQTPVAPRLAHPVKPKPAFHPLLKMESPKSRGRSNPEQNNGTPKKQKQCNCKNSRCLKLYCECFLSGLYCDGCNCINCHNNLEHETERKVAIDTILEKKPNAFRPKTAISPDGATDGAVEHIKGCNCKKSECLKGYCDCFQSNMRCSDKCRCIDCKNYEGSEERIALLPENSVAYTRQVANAAINCAIGTSCMKSLNQKTFSEVMANGQSKWLLPQSSQDTCFIPNAFYSPLPAHQSKPSPATALGSSYRSSLAGILQLEHVKDFCTLLVDVSAKTAKAFSDATSHKDGRDDPNHQNSGESCIGQENKVGTHSCEPSVFGIQNGRPLSPGTVALMCDEQHMKAETPSTKTIKSESSQEVNQLYVEQERLVLTKLHSFLNSLITCGCIEGDTMSSFS